MFDSISRVSGFKAGLVAHFPSYIMARDKEKFETMEADGVLGNQISRKIIEMIGLLHNKGYESLYLDSMMAPHGCCWDYEIGVIKNGIWPNPKSKRYTKITEHSECVRGVIWGGYDDKIR